LPLSSGAGIFLLLVTSDNGNNENQWYLGPIGLIGGLVSLGLFVFELREMVICSHLLKVGDELEERMQFKEGQFRGRPPPNLSHLLGILKRRRQVEDPNQRREWRYVIRPSVPLASGIVYLTVIAGWGYVAAVGFKS
jgi:hypothetical protein